MIDYVGWAATGVFVASYFFTRAQTMKRVQMVGALIWVTYGLMIGASPVVVANLVVFGVAGWSLSNRSTDQRVNGPTGQRINGPTGQRVNGSTGQWANGPMGPTGQPVGGD